MGRPFSDVSRVFMKCGREHKIAEEILAGNVAYRSAESLGIGVPIPAIERRGMCSLGHGCIKRARPQGERSGRLVNEVVPLVFHGFRGGGGGRSPLPRLRILCEDAPS